MRKLLCAFFVLALGMCIASAAWGQATGSFSGTVQDKSGSPVSGATVTATSQITGLSRSTKSDDAGHYLIPLLSVSIYTVRAEFTGFQTVENKNLRLQVDEALELNFTLSPGTVTATVEVSGSAVAVETTNPSLGQVITAQEVSQLPLNGRDFVQLATLTPGTTQETNANSFFNGGGSSEVAARGSFSLSVGGSRPNSTDWLLDGNDNNELTAGGIGILSSIDSIQEFKVLTYNYSAEYGTRAGPTVLVTTKSGGNDFHGSLFEFLRNTSLDAKSFFATTPEKFNLNQFGGSIGGPIRKNKTFFFLDGEQKYQRHGITFTGLVPTDAMRTGDFTNNAVGQPNLIGAITNPYVTGAANTDFQCDPVSGNPLPANANGSQPSGVNCNKIPSNLFDPIGKELIALYPHSNTTNTTSFFNFVNEPVRKLDETKFDVRLDHNFSSSDTAFARFSYDQANSYVPGGGGPGNFTESFYFSTNQGLINHARNIALSETHVFSPTTVNQVGGGYNRIFNYITSQGTGTCASAKLSTPIPGANIDPGCVANNKCSPTGISCGLTITQVLGGYFSVGDRGFSPFTGGTNVFSINDTLDMTRGKHDIKVGGSIRANQMNTKTEGFQDGFWSITGGVAGDPEADFLLGFTSLAIHDQTFKGPTTGRRWKIFRPFVQDDWRISKSITLNLGLAWNLTTPTSEARNRQADFNPVTGLFLVPGVNGVGKWAGIQFDKTALEPRIGVAWKPFGSNKTAVRAGYAIYHDSSWNQGAQGLWQNPPYYDESDAFAGFNNCPSTTPSGTASACVPLLPANVFPGALSISRGNPGAQFPQPPGFAIITGPPVAQNFIDFTGTILAQNTDFKLGRVQQFNVNLERQLPGEIVLTVGYAGSRGSHILIDSNNLEVTTPSACGVVPGYTIGCAPGGKALPVPYADFPFNIILNVSDQGRAHYNSFQAKAETKSSRHGLYALFAYTYSRSYDNGLPDGLGSNTGATYYPLPNFYKLDWALSQINIDNNFTGSVIYDLPFGKGKRFGFNWNNAMNSALGGWQLTVIEHITSGFPVFVVASDPGVRSGVFFQQGNNGIDLNRPDQVGDPNKGGGGPGCPAQVHTVANWFNPCAFKLAANGELGDANRAPLNGPDFVNTDFSVIKQFALPWENMGLNFRAEFFNLFNHAQFALPNAASSPFVSDISAPRGFGAISSTINNPRVIQFGLKLTF